MKRVVFLRLVDPRYDARIQKTATTLAMAGYDVTVIFLPARNANPSVIIPNVALSEVSLLSRNLPQKKIFLMLKYVELALRSLVLALWLKADFYVAGTTDELLLAWLVSWVRKAKLIYHAQELYAEMDHTQLPRLWAWIERQLLTYVHGITAVNEERADVMLKEYNAPYRPVVIENCPPVYDPDTVERINWPVGAKDGMPAKVVLYQGGVKPGRGLPALIEAIKYLNENENVYLAIVGPQDPRFVESLGQLVSNLEISDRVMWFDRVPWEQLRSYTVSAHVGVVFYEPTCRNNYLCAPNKLYEYLMAGVPVVVSDLPSLRRVVDETGVGIIVNSSRPESIAAGLQSILASEQRRMEMSRACRELSLSRFNWEAQAKKLLALYENLASLPPKSQGVLCNEGSISWSE